MPRLNWETFERNEKKNCSIANFTKWRGKRRDANWDRPGREQTAEVRYLKGKLHSGKSKTLRTHRK